MGQHNNKLGAWGEDRAARWYRKRGYRVLDRNWRNGRRGELDLVLLKDRQLVFCEVKTRSSHRYGAPIEAITEAKAHRIRRLAAAWRDTNEVRGTTSRFDVVAVVGADLTVYEGVF